ncbi:hypothetical protein DL96DRAFT_1124588 [Flagelloscypha sp. PMI_526]|nr:hypothetical protein DL96DRAFT_1124588 [Flagelloscypha sp. PMI_526]
MSSALLNTVGNTSGYSAKDLSLGSLSLPSTSISGQTPRVPSTTSQSTAPSSSAIGTPSPPSHRRQRSSTLKPDDDFDALATPVSTRTPAKAKQPTGVSLTLRDQEKHIDSLKKENFSIKLRVHFLEERLAQLAPDHIDAALKQNINLKIEVQQRGVELKKLKKLVLELEKELGRNGGGGSRERERELEHRLEEREREIAELLARLRSIRDGDDDVQSRNIELEDELSNVRGLLQENIEEIDRLNGLLDSGTSDSQLREENKELRLKLEDHVAFIGEKEEEKEDLLDEIESLRLALEEAQSKLEAHSIERSESRAALVEERERTEDMEELVAELRDKSAALQIELDQKDDEIHAVKDHADQEFDQLEQEWRNELLEAQAREDELREVLAKQDAESKELRIHMAELESTTNDLHGELEHLEDEVAAKDERITGLEETIEKLGEQVLSIHQPITFYLPSRSTQIYQLEDENDRLREEFELEREREKEVRDEEESERQRLEETVEALQDKLTSTKAELDETTILYQQLHTEIHSHRQRQDELATHIEELLSSRDTEQAAREQAEDSLASLSAEHESTVKRLQRSLESKEGALQSALADMARAESILRQREADLEAIRSALRDQENANRKAGDEATTARFSLQLEVDRLKRDLERVEDDLARARRDLDDKDSSSRQWNADIDRLTVENRQLASQNSSLQQTKLNLSERVDGLLASIKEKEKDLETFRTKAEDLEGRLSKEQKALLGSEGVFRDQLTERNTLLLTVWQYLDRILGVDKTPKTETKPFTNFSVFHSNLLSRLKTLSSIQTHFESRLKDTEAVYADKVADIKKTLETRWKSIEKFESNVKALADMKSTWRRKFSMLNGELDALKATNAELQNQLSSMTKKGMTPSESSEIRSLTTRATNAERRLNNAQNQLLAAEKSIASVKERAVASEAKWDARVKEWESRLKVAEEKYKRERQGGKERTAEMEAQIKSLQRQVELEKKRISAMDNLLESNKSSPTPGKS